jgi:hypothetical protein
MSCKNEPANECMRCGACCAYSYDWPEFTAEEDGNGIPIKLVDCERGRMRCTGDRCNALKGQIGVSVRCSVYKHRPAVCREFGPQSRSEDCAKVRAWFDLPPLPTAQ